MRIFIELLFEVTKEDTKLDIGTYRNWKTGSVVRILTRGRSLIGD